MHWVHDVLRRVYYIPIILSAFDLGLRGGVTAAVVVSLCYVPHAFFGEHMQDPAGTLEKLLKPKNKKKLAAILTYHVVAGRVTAEEAFGLRAAVTVQGDALKVRAGKKTTARLL